MQLTISAWSLVHACVAAAVVVLRAAKLPRQATCAVEPSSCKSNKHSWPEFYLSNAQACPGIAQAMRLSSWPDLGNGFL